MAKIPTLESIGIRPSVAANAGGIVRIPPIGASGQILQGLGKNIQGFSQQMQVVQDRENQYFVQDASNNLKKDILEIRNDYRQKKSGAVDGNNDFFNGYMLKLDSARKKISDNLKNDEQREIFKQRGEIAKISFGGQLASHITEQSDVFKSQVYAGGLGVNIESAAANYNIKNAVLTDILSTKELTEAEMIRLGMTGDARKLTLFENESDIHVAVIKQAITNNDPSYAAEWYDRNKAKISAAKKPAIERILKKTTDRKEAQGIVDNYMAEQMSIVDAKKDARKRYSGALEDQIIQRLDRRHNEIKIAEQDDRKEATDYVWSFLLDPDNEARELPDETWLDRLPPAERRRVESWVTKKGSNGGRKQSDRDAMMLISEMARSNPDGVTNDFIRRLSPLLNDTDYRSALKLIGKPDNIESWDSKEEVKKTIIVKAGLNPDHEFTGGGDSERIEILKGKINIEFKKLNRKPTIQEIQKIGDDLLLDKVYVNTWNVFSFDKQVPVNLFNETEMKNLEDTYVTIDGANIYTYKQILPTERTRIIADIEKANVPVTEETIARLWLDLKGKPKKGNGLLGQAEFRERVRNLSNNIKDIETRTEGLDTIDDLRTLMAETLNNAINLTE